jgi:hypothetical protein
MKLRTIFVIGKGRSGSTLVGDFLGSLPGVFHTGELNKMWEYSLVGDHSCACGAKLDQCPVWSEIIRVAKLDERCAWCFDDPQEMMRLQRRWRSFWGALLVIFRRDSAKRYTRSLEGILAAVQTVTQCHTVVDTSKWPLDPRFFDRNYSGSLDILHLVRDPWSVSKSWETPKKMPYVDYSLPKFGKIFSAVSWSTRVLLSEAVRRWRTPSGALLHFEDVVENPEETLKQLATSLRLSGAESLLNDRHVCLAPGHTVLGNPSRFLHGETVISKPGKPVTRNRMITVLTWPARGLVGYPRHVNTKSNP